jgi:hypothetical protein
MWQYSTYLETERLEATGWWSPVTAPLPVPAYPLAR